MLLEWNGSKCDLVHFISLYQYVCHRYAYYKYIFREICERLSIQSQIFSTRLGTYHYLSLLGTF